MSDNVTRAEEIVETWLSMNLTKARLVGQIVAALDHREVAIFRALKVTIRALADEQGVTVEENEYPCNMLAALVRAVGGRGVSAATPGPEGSATSDVERQARELVDRLRRVVIGDKAPRRARIEALKEIYQRAQILAAALSAAPDGPDGETR